MDAGFFYTIYSIGMKRIAIQGTLGSYHDIAAHKYFEGEEIELICCAKAAHKLSANTNYAFRTASFACPKRTGMTLPR